MNNPTAFISYSHDSDDHKNWVLKLANRLVKNGVVVVLDQYNLQLGGDLPSFMEKGLSIESRVICVCSERYTQKADNGQGGVGYEKMIMTGELIKDINTKWIIPIIRNNPARTVPKFLSTKLYGDFNNDADFERAYEQLLREILNVPAHPVPELGQSPFVKLKESGRIIFRPSDEKYQSPGHNGIVNFDYSNNNGKFTIGDGEMSFETKWSKASDTSIYVLNDFDSIDCLALAVGIQSISEITDAYKFDYSSRHRTPRLGEIVLWQNKNGYFAATQIITIKDRGRNSDKDEVMFVYKIQSNASGDFSN